MTTIVFVETPAAVFAGSDSQVTSGHSKVPLADGKIATVGDFTFGVAGLFELLGRLQRAEWPAVEGDTDAFVNDTLIPWLLEQQSKIFADFNISEDSDNPFFQPPRSAVLLSVRGRVYEIELVKGMTPVRNANGTYSIGSGSVYALGSLSGTSRRDKKAVLNALEAAAQNDIGTSGPFVVKTVKTRR